MDIKTITRKTIVTISVISVTLLLQGCPSECVHRPYNFSIDLHTETTVTFDLNKDTIWITALFQNPMDTFRKQKVIYTDGYFENVMSVEHVSVGTNLYSSCASLFTYVSKKGEVKEDINRSISFNEENRILFFSDNGNSNFELQIGLVPKMKGTYFIYMNSGLSNRKGHKECEQGGEFIFEFDHPNLAILKDLVWTDGKSKLGKGDEKSHYAFYVQ